MKTKINPEKIREFFNKYEYKPGKIDEEIFHKLERLLSDYGINTAETPYFYEIYREYERLIPVFKKYDQNDSAHELYNEQIRIFDFLAYIEDKPDQIKSITIKTLEGKDLKIETKYFKWLFFDEFIFKNYKSETENLDNINDWLMLDPIKKGKSGKPISGVKQIIRILNSCLIKFIAQYQVNYEKLNKTTVEFSPETFIHDFLCAIGKLRFLDIPNWNPAKLEKQTYYNKIDFCQKIALF